MTNLPNDPTAPVPQNLSDTDPTSLVPPWHQPLPLAVPSADTALLASQMTTAALRPLQTRPSAKPRNGKIAHLPKLEREMVNRMLANNISHRCIVDALDERGFQVTQRNISNWKTRGGYREWCATQQRALELRTFQDNLTEFLRRHDASELPEVGLQSAATNLSAILLRPDLMRELLSDPQKYSRLIDMQCRLAREIQALQKNRDDAATSLARECNPERVKRQDEHHAEAIRENYSSKPGRSAREPNTPHRNFIPRQLDPKPPTYRLPIPTHLPRLQTALAASTPPADHSPRLPVKPAETNGSTS